MCHECSQSKQTLHSKKRNYPKLMNHEEDREETEKYRQKREKNSSICYFTLISLYYNYYYYLTLTLLAFLSSYARTRRAAHRFHSIFAFVILIQGPNLTATRLHPLEKLKTFLADRKDRLQFFGIQKLLFDIITS